MHWYHSVYGPQPVLLLGVEGPSADRGDSNLSGTANHRSLELTIIAAACCRDVMFARRECESANGTAAECFTM